MNSLSLTMKPRVVVVLAALGLMSSCSLFDSNKVNYKAQVTKQPIALEVPPDLSQLNRETRYMIPGNSVSANDLNQVVQPKNTIAPMQLADIRMEHLGSQHWLVIKRPATSVWPVLKKFWLDNGFAVTTEDAKTGFIETDWLENKSNLPQDFISRTLNKYLSSAMSSGIRDKFITRLESGEKEVEITIAHRSIEEVSINAIAPGTAWRSRPKDPEAENEYLRRLMIALGAPEIQAQEIMAKSQMSASQRATLESSATSTGIAYQENFDTAWRRVGVALDRSGFTVEDRDRKLGLYYVRFVDRALDGKEPGFFSRLWGSSATPEGPQRYRLKLEAVNDQASRISILNATGEADHSNAGQKIAQLLVDELK
jgi:outer membrane protein assembly factor BamC